MNILFKLIVLVSLLFAVGCSGGTASNVTPVEELAPKYTFVDYDGTGWIYSRFVNGERHYYKTFNAGGEKFRVIFDEEKEKWILFGN